MKELNLALLSLESRMRGVARMMSSYDGKDFQKHSSELVRAADSVSQWASAVRELRDDGCLRERGGAAA